MKARLLNEVTDESTGTVWPKGTEVDIIGEEGGTVMIAVRVVFPDEHSMVLPLDFVEVIKPVDWQQVRINTVTAVAQGLSANPYMSYDNDYIVENTFKIADKVVERLKEEM